MSSTFQEDYLNEAFRQSLFGSGWSATLGFIAAGFVPVFANDISADAMKTYSAAMDAISKKTGKTLNHRIVTGDIREVEELPERGSAELVIGGPPCQGFSVAGKMDPNDPRSRHVFDFLGMVERGPASGVCDGERQGAR